jgi:3-deoxy-manno-octulosonate cytidylyltransferase (CMP-KDO synthetase)
MPATVIIPARMGSTRFPGKMLASQTGRPLVQHVVDQVRCCRHVNQVVVAMDDERIAAALKPFGTRCVMTLSTHASGTDRIAEVAKGLDDSIIVNVQGDEPEIEPQIVDALIQRLEGDAGQDMATAATPFPTDADPSDPNLVKVVMDQNGQAIYFSRSPIPYPREPAAPENAGHWLHLGLYAYRRAFLLQFTAWPPTPLEQTEKLEQKRALEHGAAIGVLKVERATHGIDTAEQYEAFVRRWSAASH